MTRREDLQYCLERIFHTKNVYFQPPSNLQMRYPCVVYDLDNIDVTKADNKLYKRRDRWVIHWITKDPDNFGDSMLAAFDYCSFATHYVANNLHHYTYELYF